MKLEILGSSSLGNCYVIQDDTEALILEAGVCMAEVKKAVKWKINKVVGAFITHEHNDHAGFIREMAAAGIPVLALESVFASHGLTGAPFTKVIQSGKGYKVGNFKVLALEVKHDVPCVSYVVSHPKIGNMVFITDTVTFPYRLKGLNHIMIEANYADDIVDANIAAGRMPEAMRSRLINSHMEITQTKAILRTTDLTQVDNVILIHLSNGNSDEQRFVREVQELTGAQVYAADAGMRIEISKEPY